MEKIYDVLIIGGGQSGLANAYYLRRAKLDYLILDEQETCGGAWNKAWDSLTLFSPADHSSLPGWPLPKSDAVFPRRMEVVNYLCEYIKHYQLPIQSNTKVETVSKENGIFTVSTNKGNFSAKSIIAATGTWGNPFIPKVDGLDSFQGSQLHSAFYKNALGFENKTVLVVGEGNSGAQIVAEVSMVADVKWSTRKEPRFLPDDVDGFDLFNTATAKFNAEKAGIPYNAANYDLSSIVMVQSVKDARERGVLKSLGSINHFYDKGVVWSNGNKTDLDAIIWCTGFGYNTFYLKGLVTIDERGITPTIETKSTEMEGLWLSGFGNWTGFASATLIGINRNAKQTVAEIIDFLSKS